MKRTHRLHCDGKLGAPQGRVLSLLQFLQMFADNNVITDQTGNNDEMFQKLAKGKKKKQFQHLTEF